MTNKPLKLEQDRVEETQVDLDMSNSLAFFRKMSEMRKFIATKELTVDGWNEHQKYEYSSAKQYKALLNEACMKFNMEFYVVMNTVETIQMPNEKSNQHMTRIGMTLILIDLDTGFSIGFPVIADGCDSLDKGIYKAETMAIKSFVQMTFLRHDKDEIDPESAGKKLPQTFTTTADRAVKAKATVASVEKATEEITDKIYQAIMAVREVEPDYLKEGHELDKFNNDTLTQVEATSLLLSVEEYAEEIGVTI